MPKFLSLVTFYFLFFSIVTSNLVDVLEWETERLVGGALRWDDGVESIEQGLAGGVSVLALDVPSLEPGHVGRGLEHVVAVEARNGHERHGLRVVADLLDEAGHLQILIFKN